ncbi:MAG TPA: response regulator [bacterium]|nr:response regulator [bacterium]HPM60283.1 response regulator [bacterium]
MKELRTLIIDDEWLIRLELRRMLQSMPNIRIVGEAATVAEAAQLAESASPDLVFLDLQLGDGSGADFLNLAQGTFSLIFVTAFECNLPKVTNHPTLACLAKPINKDKLFAVLQTLQKGEGVQV